MFVYPDLDVSRVGAQPRDIERDGFPPGAVQLPPLRTALLQQGKGSLFLHRDIISARAHKRVSRQKQEQFLIMVSFSFLPRSRLSLVIRLEQPMR